MPRIKNSIAGTDDFEAGFDLGVQAPPELREGGIDASDIDIIAGKDLHSAAAEAKFMEEKVIVEIEASSDDENQPIFLYFGHNGVTQYIKVGEEQAIKRKFLYAALAAKRVKMACSFGKTANGGEFNNLKPSAATTHRIHLVRDNNPQGGMKWFQGVMRAAA